MRRGVLIVGVIVLAGIVTGAMVMLLRGKSQDPATPETPNLAKKAPSAVKMTSRPTTTVSASLPTTTQSASAPATRPNMRALTATEAVDCFYKGMKLLEGEDPLGARHELSRAVLSGRLPADKDETARTKLTELAEQTLFSRSVTDGDPYTGTTGVKSGDVLERMEKRLRLHVPPQLLVRINGLASASQLQAGKRIKVIHGPFHAIVWKKRFIMDVFLQREDLPPVWVKRFSVGLGKQDSPTPVGMWAVGSSVEDDGRVLPGGKQVHPTWTPTTGPYEGQPIPYGHKDYALGTKGLWIGLVGTVPATRTLNDYAIHSTNAPKSIGKEESSGCVRLADDDIELVYSLLYEVWSTVETRN